MAKLTPIQRTAMEWSRQVTNTSNVTLVDGNHTRYRQSVPSVKKGYIEITGIHDWDLDDPYFVVCGSQVNVLIPVEITTPSIKRLVS